MEIEGIPNAEFETFGTYDGDGDGSDIPHHNLITMNGMESVSAGSGPEVSQNLAENVREDIRKIISSHFKEEWLSAFLKCRI